MGLLSSLKRNQQAPEPRKRTPPPQDPAEVEVLRTRARRRLIGSAVLVAAAVVGLPTIFDAPPRPTNQDFTVRMSSQDGQTSVSVKPAEGPLGIGGAGRVPLDEAAPVEASPAASGTAGHGKHSSAASNAPVAAAATLGVVAGGVAMAARQGSRNGASQDNIVTESKQDAAAAETARAERQQRERAKQDKDKADAKAEKAKEKAKSAKDKADNKAEKSEKADKAERADKTDKGTRYVVQVGSYAEASTVKTTRQKVGSLGLSTHEQQVETASGQTRTRVRVGPFATQEEAHRAAARLKAAGMNAAIMPQ